MRLATTLILLFTPLIKANKRCSKLFLNFHSFKDLSYNSLTTISCVNKHQNISNILPNAMKSSNLYIVVYVTAPNEIISEKIAKALLNEKLAACVNIVPGISSLYHWEGKINKDKEVLMIIKSEERLFDKIEKLVKDNHPYDVPEVIAIPIHHGSKEYLNWLSNSLETEKESKNKEITKNN